MWIYSKELRWYGRHQSYCCNKNSAVCFCRDFTILFLCMPGKLLFLPEIDFNYPLKVSEYLFVVVSYCCYCFFVCFRKDRLDRIHRSVRVLSPFILFSFYDAVRKRFILPSPLFLEGSLNWSGKLFLADTQWGPYGANKRNIPQYLTRIFIRR